MIIPVSVPAPSYFQITGHVIALRDSSSLSVDRHGLICIALDLNSVKLSTKFVMN